MKPALLVSHGQPSAPRPAGAALEALAARVAALRGAPVLAATLAEPGALDAATAAMPEGGLVVPIFMARGWFTRTALPERLASAAPGRVFTMAEPLGETEAFLDLALQVIREHRPREVLVAAHGSFRSPAPAAIADRLAARIAALPGIERATAAFIDQAPRLADTSGWQPGALCLPFFAMAGGHVIEDLPQALEAAGFPGVTLPALGLDPRVPGLIAAMIEAAG